MSEMANMNMYVLGNQVTQWDIRYQRGEAMSDTDNISIYVLGYHVTQGGFR